MKFVYFTKTLRELDLKGHIDFLSGAGLDGADLTIRPGFPINPDNVERMLPGAMKQFEDAGLIIGLVSAPTNMDDPSSKTAKTLFEACGRAGVPAIKIGYYRYTGNFEKDLRTAREGLKGFAKLAEKTGVRACYHTHSGTFLGCNAASARLLLTDLDPHHVGAYLDTGHTTVDGGPLSMELDTLRSWLSLIAIKDMRYYEQQGKGWRHSVVPAGEGIVSWKDFAKGVKAVKFNGTVSLHAEYHTKTLEERQNLAKKELAYLKSVLGV